MNGLIASAFATSVVDLTTAHINFEIKVGDFAWVQFWCDGTPYGVKVSVGTQDKDLINLDRFSSIPVVQGTKIYVTNDVRPGRSQLLLVFSRTTPLSPWLAPGQITLPELAARLGSIHTFDRRGEVLWYDDFESNLNKWEVTLNGTRAAAGLSNSYARSGALSCKLTSGSGINDSAQIAKYLPYKTTGRIGFEVSWIRNANLAYNFSLYLYNGTNYSLGLLAYGPTAKTITLLYGTIYSVAITTDQPTFANAYLFNTIKLVCDFTTKKYVRLIFNNVVYDISQYTMRTVASASAPHIEAIIMPTTDVASNQACYVDDAIITENEP